MRVFVSHAFEDRAAAKQVVDVLLESGVSTWIPEELAAGDNIPLSIGKALEASDAMVVLLSPNSVKSRAVQQELEYALMTPRFDQRVFAIKVRATRSSSVPWILNRLGVHDGTKRLKFAASKVVAALANDRRAAAS